MPSRPPLLPEEALVRVLRVAKFDGLSVLVLGSLFAVMAAAARDIPFATVGLIAAGAGAIELHGAALLRQAEPRGMSWLLASQPLLLVAVLGYCGLRLTYVGLPELPENWRSMIAMSADQFGMSVEDYVAMVNRITASVVAVVAIVYQGGMTLYYARRRKAVVRALEM